MVYCCTYFFFSKDGNTVMSPELSLYVLRWEYWGRGAAAGVGGEWDRASGGGEGTQRLGSGGWGESQHTPHPSTLHYHYHILTLIISSSSMFSCMNPHTFHCIPQVGLLLRLGGVVGSILCWLQLRAAHLLHTWNTAPYYLLTQADLPRIIEELKLLKVCHYYSYYYYHHYHYYVVAW